MVSRDLAEFAHIHPEPAPGDVFTVEHTFAHGSAGTHALGGALGVPSPSTVSAITGFGKPGRTTLIELPPSKPGKLHFACGLGMYAGELIVR